MGRNITVNTDVLRSVESALNRYMEDFSMGIAKMKDAAIDCSDNMDSDAISKKNIDRLEECIDKLSATIPEAEELRKMLQDMIQKTDELGEDR